MGRSANRVGSASRPGSASFRIELADVDGAFEGLAGAEEPSTRFDRRPHDRQRQTMLDRRRILDVIVV